MNISPTWPPPDSPASTFQQPPQPRTVSRDDRSQEGSATMPVSHQQQGCRTLPWAVLLLANCASLEPVRKRLGICDARRQHGRCRGGRPSASAGPWPLPPAPASKPPAFVAARAAKGPPADLMLRLALLWRDTNLSASGGVVARWPTFRPCACVCRQAGDGFNRVGRAERASVSVSRRSVPSNQGLLLG